MSKGTTPRPLSLPKPHPYQSVAIGSEAGSRIRRRRAPPKRGAVPRDECGVGVRGEFVVVGAARERRPSNNRHLPPAPDTRARLAPYGNALVGVGFWERERARRGSLGQKSASLALVLSFGNSRLALAPSFGNARLALALDIGGSLDPIGVGTEGVCGFRALVGGACCLRDAVLARPRSSKRSPFKTPPESPAWNGAEFRRGPPAPENRAPPRAHAPSKVDCQPPSLIRASMDETALSKASPRTHPG